MTSARRSAIPEWPLPIAIDRTSARGARDKSSAVARPSSVTVIRRSLRVSRASGVIWPPRARATDAPRSSTRASASVIMSNVFMQTPPEILLSEDQIQKRVAELALQLRHDYPAELHLVAVLKGAFVFLSDLIRRIPGDLSLDFIAASSYAQGTTTSGQVRLLNDLDTAIEGKHVVIVEDIVDSGTTLGYLQQALRARHPRSLATVCLLSKPARRQIDVKIDYVGFTIDDRFVVGYGLDYAGRYRNLPHIAAIQS